MHILIFPFYLTKVDAGPKNSASFDNSQQIDEEMKARIKEQIQQLVEFETEIAKITKSQAERRQDSKTYRNTSLSKLNEKADFLDWKVYFNRAFMEHLNRSLEEEYQDVTYAEEYIGTISIQILFEFITHFI